MKQYYGFGHSACMCGGKAIFVREFERPEMENGHPKHMGKSRTVRVYKCPDCNKMWQLTVKK